MFDKLKSFLALPKKEVRHDVGLAFIAPVLNDIKEDIESITKSFDTLQNLIDSGFKIDFDKIPSEQLSDLIEKITEASAIVEASDAADKVKITEIAANLHDNAVKCSAMSAFLVNSTSSDDYMNEVWILFKKIRNDLKEMLGLL